MKIYRKNIANKFYDFMKNYSNPMPNCKCQILPINTENKDNEFEKFEGKVHSELKNIYGLKRKYLKK